MMKSMKSKIAAGVVVVSVVAGTSTVFAGVDAGAQFKNWYGSLFGKTTATIQAQVATDYAANLSDYQKEYNTLKNTSKQEIVTEAGVKVDSANSAIKGQKDGYISQINGAKADINVAGDFSKFVTTTNQGNDIIKEGVRKTGEADLKSTLNKQGQDSVKEVNKQVTASKDAATQELTDKIAAAKKEIQDLVAQQATAADKSIRDHIDAKIVELRQQLQAYAAELVAQNKAKVDAEGDKVQQEATDALDAIAASINK